LASAALIGRRALSKPKVVFMGTPEFAVPSLESVAHACDVRAVVTRPDRPRGRGRKVSPSEVALAAERLGLTVIKPEDPNADDSIAALAALEPDLFAVVAFGSILSRRLLQIPRVGSINLHGSLLPHYRGASPVQRALWDGLPGTGVTTLWMDDGIDTGDLILQRWIGIEPGDHAGSLASRLAVLGAPLLTESLALAHQGRAPRHAQEKSAGSYAARIRKHEGVVNWSLDAETVWRRQRALTPWPGAVTGFRGKRLLLTETWPLHRLPSDQAPGTVLGCEAQEVTVACAPGALILARVKPDGRSEMDAAEWARGARLERGERLEIEIEKEAHA
jgi:methionyl-tRNA formyltransferase